MKDIVEELRQQQKKQLQISSLDELKVTRLRQVTWIDKRCFSVK